MKNLIPTFILAAGCISRAEPPVIAPVPPPAPPDVYIVAQAPAAAPARASVTAAAQADVARVQSHVARLHADSATAWGMPGKVGSSGSRRTLVIPKGDIKPELLTDAEEDLNVMALILEKALEQRGEDEGRKALGIDVFSSSSGIRNLLIEGHGAIFALKTKIALVPPPAPKKEETKAKETTSSEWDDARRQLYGPSEIEKEFQKAFGKGQMNFNSNEDYDEKKLERLKESLTDSLKSAANIRHLAGDQTVTVVVVSSSPVTEIRKIVSEGGRGGGAGGGSGGGGRRVEAYALSRDEREIFDGRSGSRMMLQAKKSDIDSYAKGKLTTETFRDKVKIQVY